MRADGGAEVQPRDRGARRRKSRLNKQLNETRAASRVCLNILHGCFELPRRSTPRTSPSLTRLFTRSKSRAALIYRNVIKVTVSCQRAV